MDLEAVLFYCLRECFNLSPFSFLVDCFDSFLIANKLYCFVFFIDLPQFIPCYNCFVSRELRGILLGIDKICKIVA
ncbi:hypothetical protein Syun_018411 [Stephania yunnanensis]|uniref:Uncharacterized protein n=1 Tax=Stephania yunnanensis TaxID=152371 RepID=A0AAP0IS89_9MAGN